MEGEVRFDSQWRTSPIIEVQLCGQLRCPIKCVLGIKWPVCAADNYLHLVLKTKERMKIRLQLSINVHGLLYCKAWGTL